MGSLRRAMGAVLAAASVGTVVGVLALPVPASALPFGSPTYLAGVNAGGPAQVATGPDGSNLAVFYDREDLQYFSATRAVGETAWTAATALPAAAGTTLRDVAIADDLTALAVGTNGSNIIVWKKAAAASAWTAAQVVPMPATAAAIGSATQILPDGSTLFAWQDGSVQQVKAARLPFGASAFGTTQNVSASNQATAPRLWTGRNGQTALGWIKRGTTDLVTSVRPTPAANFGPMLTVPRNGIDDANLQNFELAFADDGRATMVSEARSSGNWHIIAWDLPAGAGAWNAGQTVSSVGGTGTSFPQVGISGSGETTIAYLNSLNSVDPVSRQIEATTRGPALAGSYATPTVVSSFTNYQAVPSLAVAEDGTAGLAWNYADRQFLDYGEPGTTYISANNARVSRRTAGGQWSAEETVSNRSANVTYPVATAGGTSVVAAWFQNTHYGNPYEAGLVSTGPAVPLDSELTVNSTGDKPAADPSKGCKTGVFISGKPECTLRAAIQSANAGKGNAISFDIAGADPAKITATSNLPALTKTATIDGTTESGGMVEVTGTTTTGLTISAANVTVQGLAISGFTNTGLLLDGAGGAKVQKNRFGADAGGTVYRASGNAIGVSNSPNATIGGDTEALGNQVLAASNAFGIIVGGDATHSSQGVTIRHNTMGTNPAGTAALGPGPTTAVLVAAKANAKLTVADNLVSGSYAGIEIAGAGTAETTVTGNTVGTDRAGTARLRTPTFGIRLDGSARSSVTGNVVVSTGYDISVAGSPQATFGETSYQLFPPTSSATTGTITGGKESVTGNKVGVFSNGTKAAGSGSGGISVWAGSDGTLVQDNTVAGHTSNEIAVSRGKDQRILKNRVGLNPGGTASLGGSGGIVVSGATNAHIGESNTTGNLIGGTSGPAVLVNTLSGSTGGSNVVAGNRIGFLTDGSTAAPVGSTGVGTTSPKTTIGPDNVIGNAAGGGVTVAPKAVGTTVTGNWIGVTQTGTAKAPNASGISMEAPTGSDPIKPDLLITGNTVSGNAGAGISVFGGGAKVLANRVGVGPTTLASLGNGAAGIAVHGDGAEIRGNLVGFNVQTGISVTGTTVVVASNQVGQPTGAETDVGNLADGIAVSGGDAKVTSNLIARNKGDGLDVASSAKVEARLNQIGSNTGAGIASQSSDATIRENRIGLPASGDAARPNKVGIDVTGGKALVKANRIGNNTNEGVKVDARAKATIVSNAIFADGGAGIAASTPAPAAPVLAYAVRKGTGDSARTWLSVQGPSTAGTLEVFGNVTCSDPEGKQPMVLKTWKGGTTPIVVTVKGRTDLVGYTVTFTDADGRTSAFSTCATADPNSSDGDGDGIPSLVEASGPWAGAASNVHFTAVPSDDGGFVGLQAGSGSFQKVAPVDPPDGKPAGLELPFGSISFELHVELGQATTVNVLVDGASRGTAYWRYGPPDEGKPPAWYRFDYVTASDTGAKPITKTIDATPYAGWELNLEDDARGDDDGSLNGVIVDPGGPGFGGVDDFRCPTAKGNARYVCRTYAFGLGRNPDPAGQAYWVRKLDAGTARSAVMSSFISGSESRRVIVQRLYSTYLHRGPDPSGLAYWSGKLGTGTTPEALRINLLSSNEVYRTSGGTNRDFAVALHQLVWHRAPTEAEADAATALLDGGATRTARVTAFLRSVEGRSAVVTDAYALYLERPSTPSETTYWQGQMASGLSELQLFIKLASTSEFANS